MATYAIGDVQGCFEPLERLLALTAFDEARDRAWLVGDLVNRGPRSADVLRKAMALGDCCVSVLGNHDLHLLAMAAGVRTPGRLDTCGDVLSAPDREPLLDWLRHRPLVHREAGVVMVHAGLLPPWDGATAAGLAREVESVLRGPDGVELLARWGSEPAVAWDPGLSGLRRWAAILHGLTRLRTCRLDGTPCPDFSGPPEEAPPGCRPWFRVPGRRSAGETVVFGHWAALGLLVEPGLLGLDTGCAWGRSLTAVRLEDRAVFQVTAAAPG